MKNYVDYIDKINDKLVIKLETYDEWQNKHNCTEEIHSSFKQKFEQKITKHLEIDARISTLEELINFIEKHPYDNNFEYQIDLKSLHAIKDDLIQINDMIGMDCIKDEVMDQLLYFIQKMHINNNEDPVNNCISQDYKHTMILGPPGTGKTHLARILGNMYSKIGILKNNIFMKVTRSDLIAGYLGQTAIKTTDVIKKCLGGCLFIDEAYSLASSNESDSFSKECIDTLCECLSLYKNNLMVIIAGYEEDICNRLFSMNKGIESRFIWRYKISPYTGEQLFYIFKKKVQDIGWNIDSIDGEVYKWFIANAKDFTYYGRDIEFLLSFTKICHSRRVFGKSTDIMKYISIEDIENGMKKLKDNRGSKVELPNMYI